VSRGAADADRVKDDEPPRKDDGGRLIVRMYPIWQRHRAQKPVSGGSNPPSVLSWSTIRTFLAMNTDVAAGQ
jgi:hypothetical protein